MILVTGATGFVGRRLMARLRQQGEAVRPLVRDAATAGRLGANDERPAIGDVTDPASLCRAMDGVDTVIHLAAIDVGIGNDIGNGRQAMRHINAPGTRNIAAAAISAGVTRILHLSAISARGNARHPYLQAEWQGQQAVIDSGISYGILRPSLIFGHGDQFFTSLARLVRANPIVPIAGNGTSMFQPIWVEDVCTCLLRMLDDDTYLGHGYDVGGPEHLSYDDLVDVVMRVLGKRRPKLHISLALLQPAAAAMQALLPAPPITTAYLDMLAIDNINITTLDALPRLFGIDKPAYLQAKLDYILSYS